MGQTVGFAASSWLVRQVARLVCRHQLYTNAWRLSLTGGDHELGQS